MIVLIESHERARAPVQPQASAPECGGRWGKASEYGFDQTDAEAENAESGGFNTVERSSSPSRIKVWNLSPVWRAYDVVNVPSSADPAQTIEATVTRQLLVPVESSTQKYVGGGIGYVEDPKGYGSEERTIHTYVLLNIPSPLPHAEVVESGVEGEWPSYPTEAFAPGAYSPTAPLPGPWTR